MQRYELPVLVKPLLPDDIKGKVVAKMEEIVKNLNGTLETKEVWGKKHLAYPIKKHQEGYYIFFTLELDPANIGELQKSLRLMNDVLRFMLIKEDKL